MKRAQETLTISAETRPIRVAYLVDVRTPSQAVDAIIESALDRWGGRRRGIFPLVSGQIPQPWWRPLEALDPDLVLFTGGMSGELRERITRRIQPYAIEEFAFRQPEDPADRWRLTHPAAGLDILGVPRTVAAERWGGSEPQFAYLHEETGSCRDRRFVLHNFGLLPPTVPVRAAFHGVAHHSIDCADKSAAQVLEAMNTLGRELLTPIELATREASMPRMPLENAYAHSEFQLVVGETLRDVILAWNRGLFVDPTRRTLWAPLPLFDAPGFFEAFLLWLRRVSWRHDERGTVVSYGHTAAEIELVATRLRTDFGRQVATRALSPEEYPFPAIATEHGMHANELFGSYARTEHVPFTNGKGTVAVAPPPIRGVRFPQGEVMVDLVIPHRPELHGSDVTWRLPKRPALARTFVESREARVTATGLPSVKIDLGPSRLNLRIPSDQQLFSVAVLGPPRTANDGPSPVEGFTTSSAGAAVRGVIELFGGLEPCGHTLTDPFWREMLGLLAGQMKPVQSERSDLLLTRLREHLEQHTDGLFLESPELSEVADSLARALREEQPKRRPWITEQRLAQCFGRLRRRGLSMASSVDEGNFWEAEESFNDDKRDELDDLISRGVFANGRALECPRCRSINWYPLAAFRPAMVCAGCGATFAMPRNEMPSFKLNTLVENAFTTSGSLVSLQALHNAGMLCQGPFVFLPPQDFKLRDRQDPLEADILCFWGGSFIVGEVKTRASAFLGEDFERMRVLGHALKPHKVWFAAPQQDWPKETLDAIRALAVELAPLDVAVEVFRLGWWQMSPPVSVS